MTVNDFFFDLIQESQYSVFEMGWNGPGSRVRVSTYDTVKREGE